MGFILSIISLILFIFVHFIDKLIILIINIKSRAFFRKTNGIAFRSALDLDIYGNYAYKETWNIILVKGEYYKFGTIGETISSCLGKNQESKTLSITGWILTYSLWLIDFKYWFKGGHCLNSIMSGNEIKDWSKKD